MTKLTFTPFLIALTTITCLLSVTAVRAELDPAVDAGRICSISDGRDKTLTIVAGPDLTMGGTELADDFPELITCPSGAGVCAKWNYRYIWTNMNPSLSYVVMSSDLALTEINNGGNYYVPGEGSPTGLAESAHNDRVIRWQANDVTFDASYVTPTATPRIATAGGKSGNFEGYCPILGAGIPGNDDFLQTYTSREEVQVGRGPNGRYGKICVEREPGKCVVRAYNCDTEVEIQGHPVNEIFDQDNSPIINTTNPDDECGTTVTDDGDDSTYYYISGGRAWAVPYCNISDTNCFWR